MKRPTFTREADQHSFSVIDVARTLASVEAGTCQPPEGLMTQVVWLEWRLTIGWSPPYGSPQQEKYQLAVRALALDALVCYRKWRLEHSWAILREAGVLFDGETL